MKLVTNERSGQVTGDGGFSRAELNDPKRDPLAELNMPGSGFGAIENEPGIPLPANEWERVSRWARTARSKFMAQGHSEVAPLERSMTAVEVALVSLEDRKPHLALRYLREAELEIGRFHKAAEVKHESRLTFSDSVQYGCHLAIEKLKETVGQCIRAVVSKESTALVRARVSLEDAAMCVLAAAARQNN